jgi:oligopeptide/dipeptide ABC transporter ATP-binding protein
MTAVREVGAAHDQIDTSPALELRNVSQRFLVRRRGGASRNRILGKRWLSALEDVSLTVNHGETVAVVGETGSGKSTLARSVILEPPPKSGQILVEGADITALDGGDLMRTRRKVQMVFQDPFSALDSRWTVRRIVGEPLVIQGEGAKAEIRARVDDMLQRVGLNPSRYGDRYPREMSGGECQRVAIARALILRPTVVICDEPVTALDVSIQAQILNLLADLREEFALTYLLIAHDLTVVEVLSQRVFTMYLGRICELGPTETIFDRPAHPYTTALLSAVPPRPGRPTAVEAIQLSGEIPSPLDPPSGCRFRTRCPIAEPICSEQVPAPREVGPGHSVMCHFPYGFEHRKTRQETS